METFLDPAKRKLLYGIIGAVAVIVVTLGLAPQVTVDNWVNVIIQVLGVVALILAMAKSQRWDYKALYGGIAAVVAGLTAAGVFNDGVASHIYEVMAQLAIILPLLTAFVRTNSNVPTGEPAAEYLARKNPSVPDPA